MALIKCKECKHEISKNAKTCPNCGAKNKSSSGGCLILMILGIIIFFGVMAGADDPSSGSAKNPVSASIHKTVSTLYATNEDTFYWPSVTVYINGIMGGYSYEYNRELKPNETAKIGLLNFTKSSGDRFQPLQNHSKSFCPEVLRIQYR